MQSVREAGFPPDADADARRATRLAGGRFVPGKVHSRERGRVRAPF